jgi:hypothetical protein
MPNSSLYLSQIAGFSEYERTCRAIPSIRRTASWQKEPVMLFEILSVELLCYRFRRAVMQALENCEESNCGHYRYRCRLLSNAPWVEIGPHVQAIQATESEFLIRGSWQFSIDPSAKDQLRIAQEQVNEMASLLASAVPQGESVKVTFDFPPTETSANGKKVTCSFRAVVRGQVRCRAAA